MLTEEPSGEHSVAVGDEPLHVIITPEQTPHIGPRSKLTAIARHWLNDPDRFPNPMVWFAFAEFCDSEPHMLRAARSAFHAKSADDGDRIALSWFTNAVVYQRLMRTLLDLAGKHHIPTLLAEQTVSDISLDIEDNVLRAHVPSEFATVFSLSSAELPDTFASALAFSKALGVRSLDIIDKRSEKKNLNHPKRYQRRTRSLVALIDRHHDFRNLKIGRDFNFEPAVPSDPIFRFTETKQTIFAHNVSLEDSESISEALAKVILSDVEGVEWVLLPFLLEDSEKTRLAATVAQLLRKKTMPLRKRSGQPAIKIIGVPFSTELSKKAIDIFFRLAPRSPASRLLPFQEDDIMELQPFDAILSPEAALTPLPNFHRKDLLQKGRALDALFAFLEALSFDGFGQWLEKQRNRADGNIPVLLAASARSMDAYRARQTALATLLSPWVDNRAVLLAIHGIPQQVSDGGRSAEKETWPSEFSKTSHAIVSDFDLDKGEHRWTMVLSPAPVTGETFAVAVRRLLDVWGWRLGDSHQFPATTFVDIEASKHDVGTIRVRAVADEREYRHALRDERSTFEGVPETIITASNAVPFARNSDGAEPVRIDYWNISLLDAVARRAALFRDGGPLTGIKRLPENRGIFVKGVRVNSTLTFDEIGIASEPLSETDFENLLNAKDEPLFQRYLTAGDVMRVATRRWMINADIEALDRLRYGDIITEFVHRKVHSAKRFIERPSGLSAWYQASGALADNVNGYYIATSMLARRQLFVRVERGIAPSESLVAIMRGDYETFGILSSRVHEVWCKAVNAPHKYYQRYGAFSIETFPFPDAMNRGRKEEIGLLRELQKCVQLLESERERWLDIERNPIGNQSPQASLTKLYEGSPPWLEEAHVDIDEIVLTLYRLPKNCSDEEILTTLGNLNRERQR
jgi:hypothetical protein